MPRSAHPDRDPCHAGPWTILMVAALLVGIHGGHPLVAQGADQIPKRPHLKGDVDTNSALSYFTDGAQVLDGDPDRAAADFYWAERLDPTWAAPIYGRFAARLIALPTGRMTEYFNTWHERKREGDFVAIDSLAWLAELKNPFVDRRFDGVVLTSWVRRLMGGNDADISDIAMHNRAFSAWIRYTRGEFVRAAERYAEAIKDRPRDPDLRFERGLTFFSMGRFDSARAEVRAALTMERTRESNSYIGYASHPFLEYSLGFLYRLSDQRDSAKAAFERALLDDLTFHPAHRELAITRLAANDTTGALAEYNSAVTLSPADPGYLYEYGLLLLLSGHADSAAGVLKRSIASDPWYATPHYLLGVLYERYGFAPEATAEFTSFIGLAPASMGPTLDEARQRLAKLQEAH